MSTPKASTRARREWLNRVEAEYRSAAQTQELALWLTQIAASPDLIRAGLRVARDEVLHADLAYQVFVQAGGEGGPTLTRNTLCLARHERDPLELDITRACVDGFCLGETIAVPLFKRLRENCVVPIARSTLDRVLRDEVRHRDFGWALFGWLLEHPLRDAVRGVVERELPLFFARLRRVYGSKATRTQTNIDPADRAWGLMAPAEYADILDRTFEKVWASRFSRLGFDAEKAWNASLAIPNL